MLMVTFSFAGLPTYFVYNGNTYKLSATLFTNTNGTLADCTNTPTPDPRTWFMSTLATGIEVGRYEGIYPNNSCGTGFYAVRNYWTGQYLLDTGTCKSPNTIVNGECVAPAITCGANMTLNSSKTACVCNDGYKPDDVSYDISGNITTINTCKPLIKCPPQMKYFWTDQATDIAGLFKTEYYTCVPRSDLNEADCASQGGTYYKKSMMGESLQDFHTSYILKNGEGCVNEQWVKDDALAVNFSFIMSGFILGGTRPFPQGLVNKAVDEKQLLLAYKNSPDNANLITHKPDVTDLVMGADGVYGEIGLTAKNASQDAETASAYNKWLKDNGYITNTDEVSSTPVNNLGTSPNVSSKLNDLFYKGGDEVDFKDNMLGTANMNFGGAMPDLSSASSATIGATTATKIDLKSHLLGTEVKSYPVSLVKQYEKSNADGSTAVSYKGTVTYPDTTTAIITINQTKQSTGSAVNEVGYSYIVDTKTGSKTFNGSYTTTTDATGKVTNNVSKPSTITTINDDGSVSTSTNAGSSSVTTDQTQTAVNLSPITQRLDQIKAKLDSIQQEQIKQWEYTSLKTSEATASLTKLTQAFTDYSLSLDNLLNFADGLFSDLKNLLQAFEDAKNQFTDKPSVNIPNGTCPFTISGANRTGGPVQTYTIDPCYFLAPRKPFLVVFFTILFSWGVVMFAIKHLFNTTPNS